MLGERDVAATAFRKALEVFKNDAAASDKITAAAIGLGLKANQRTPFCAPSRRELSALALKAVPGRSDCSCAMLRKRMPTSAVVNAVIAILDAIVVNGALVGR